MSKELSKVEGINAEISRELKNEAVGRALIATTFKGLTPPLMRQALMEGMIRGFTFQEFMKKDVYAIPFAAGYSLVSSIGHTRKIAMRSGLAGKDAPTYEVDNEGKIISCTVTVKRIVNGYVGDYTATVFFDEYFKKGYSSKPSMWETKPRTMIAKVAEMHALRMAFPEELSQQYIEEEIEKDNVPSGLLQAETKVDEGNLSMGSHDKKKNQDDIEIEPIPGAESPEEGQSA